MYVHLDRQFYQRNTVVVAHSLLGCLIISEIGGKDKRTSCIIVETEAYLGETDPASHAYKKTKRAKPMYGKPGKAYMYLIYGKHVLFNVVTEPVGVPGAVLIRALQPVEGITTMHHRRGVHNAETLTNGPGNLTQALGITLAHNGLDVTGDTVWIEPHTLAFHIQSSARIGVSDMQCLRFCIKE